VIDLLVNPFLCCYLHLRVFHLLLQCRNLFLQPPHLLFDIFTQFRSLLPQLIICQELYCFIFLLDADNERFNLFHVFFILVTQECAQYLGNDAHADILSEV